MCVFSDWCLQVCVISSAAVCLVACAHTCVCTWVWRPCLGQSLGHVLFFSLRPIISHFKGITLSHQRELQKQGGGNKTQDQLTLEVLLMVHGEGHSPHGEINTVKSEELDFYGTDFVFNFPSRMSSGTKEGFGLSL